MKVYNYKNSWYYIFDIDKHPVTGKRRQIKKGGFGSEREAQRAGNKALAEYHRGNINPGDKITFGEMARMWSDEYEKRGHVKLSTVRTRKRLSNIWFRFFDSVQLKKITMTMVQGALDELRPNYADNTMSGMFETLKMIFRKARELGYINTDPCEFAYIPKQRKTLEQMEQEPIEHRYMNKDMLKTFLDTAKGYGIDHDFVLFRLLAYTGMRIGEALALKWSDIDFDNRSVSVNRRILHHKNKVKNYELDTPKTASSKRIIPIDKLMAVNLNELHEQQKWFRKKNNIKTDFGFVFISYARFGNECYPVTQANVRTRMTRILRMANIEQHVTLHTFRHTHTSLMAEAGVELTTIMERLGHKNDSITRDIYLHITHELKQQAVQKFEKLMNDFM